MISKVSIRNFKCLRDVQIDLERFTVFVGPNASGKSSILQGMDLLCGAFRSASGVPGFDGGPVQDIETELSQAVSRRSKEPVEVAAEAGGTWYRYRSRSSLAPQHPHHSAQTAWAGEGTGMAPASDPTSWRPWKPEPGRDR